MRYTYEWQKAGNIGSAVIEVRKSGGSGRNEYRDGPYSRFHARVRLTLTTGEEIHFGDESGETLEEAVAFACRDYWRDEPSRLPLDFGLEAVSR